MHAATAQLIRDYYDAFNAGDMDRFLSLLSADVIHDINQSHRETGREAFRAFMARMNRCYKEKLVDMVVFSSGDGRRAAAEFIVEGQYVASDDGLPEATGQPYRLPAGAFFEVSQGKVTRVTNYYNLADWIAQVS